MKIKKSSITTYFKDVNAGEVFSEYDRCYIKLKDTCYEDEEGLSPTNAVNLETGCTTYFKGCEQVCPRTYVELNI